MRVVVAVESRFVRTGDGAVWTQEGPTPRFFSRYLSTFDSVRVVARVQQVSGRLPGAYRVDGPSVEVWPVPYYVGPGQYLRRRRAIGRAVRAAATVHDAVVVRVPGPIGELLALARSRAGHPFAVEAMADPHDLFAPGVVHHPLRAFVRQHSRRNLGRLCQDAVAVGYVTDRYLQRRYPGGPDTLCAAYSSVDLPPEAYLPAARGLDRPAGIPTMVSVGSLEHLYKGIDTLVEALARLNTAGVTLRLRHLGDGRCRSQLDQLARRRGVADQFTITGWLPAGAAVRAELDAAEIFVMPSRTEGLPRALIEAMARGLPAIGSSVGGIPELLPADDLVGPDDPAALAESIARMLADPSRLAAASARNLARAQEFSAAALTPRRDVLYRALYAATLLQSAGQTAPAAAP